jgi:hypothetical protein
MIDNIKSNINTVLNFDPVVIYSEPKGLLGVMSYFTKKKIIIIILVSIKIYRRWESGVPIAQYTYGVLQ